MDATTAIGTKMMVVINSAMLRQDSLALEAPRHQGRFARRLVVMESKWRQNRVTTEILLEAMAVVRPASLKQISSAKEVTTSSMILAAKVVETGSEIRPS
jgi:hypothetical protein